MTNSDHRAVESAFPPTSPGAALDLIGHQFDRLVALEDSYAAFARDVSGWSVGRHVLHLAMSGSSLAVSLLTGRHWDGVPGAPELREYVLDTGRIPAGRAAAPESVRPESDPAPAHILTAVVKCRARVERITSAADDSFIIHPYLGRLSRDELVRFLAIHNRHHLNIIDRILAAV